MAFGQISQWHPALTHIDPRPQDKFSVGAKYCVVSVSRYPTFFDLKRNKKSIADTKMVGLIQSFAAPQARPIFRLFELGSRYPYTVAGKFMGTITLTSMFFDAGQNLLGGIYEEVFTSQDGNITPDGIELINRPSLYDPDKNGGINPYNYTMSDVGSDTPGPSKSWGAIRMSLDDNRLDIPFGLILTIFQSSKRIKSNLSSGEGEELGGGYSIEESEEKETYRIMSCLFFEMVRIQAYDFQVTAEQEVLFESAQFYYHGLVNVKTDVTSAAFQSGIFGRTGYDITNSPGPPTT